MFPIFQTILGIKKTDDYKAIQEDIIEVRNRIEIVNNMFSNLSDTDLIDACVYELNSLNAKYQYLLKLARSMQETSQQEKPA